MLTCRNMRPRIESSTDTSVTIRIEGEWPVGLVTNELTLAVTSLDGPISRATAIAGDGSPPGIARKSYAVESGKLVRQSQGEWLVTAPVAPDVAIELQIS